MALEQVEILDHVIKWLLKLYPYTAPGCREVSGWTLEMNDNELFSNDGGFWCQGVPTRIPSFDARSYGNGSCYEMGLSENRVYPQL